MSSARQHAVYWDASAVLSVLLRDEHSVRATQLARTDSAHLLSTLAYAEVLAVTYRLRRRGIVQGVLAESASAIIRSGVWRQILLQPDWHEIDTLSRAHSLRGADLWHLATVSTLRRELPQVRLLTFDERLGRAAAELDLRYVH